MVGPRLLPTGDIVNQGILSLCQKGYLGCFIRPRYFGQLMMLHYIWHGFLGFVTRGRGKVEGEKMGIHVEREI